MTEKRGSGSVGRGGLHFPPRAAPLRFRGMRRKLTSLLSVLAAVPLALQAAASTSTTPEGPDVLEQGVPAARHGTPARSPNRPTADPFPCAEADEGHAAAGVPSPRDRCIELHGSAATPGASGWARLLPAPIPFGAAVNRDGVHQYRFQVEVEGLPDPSELGPYDRYVAWITPPELAPTVALGTLEGQSTLLEVAGFNAFLLHISAEGPGPHDERQGPLVLRGTSSAMVLRPHDLPYMLAEMTPDPGQDTLPAVAEDHRAHDHHDAHDAHAAGPYTFPEGGPTRWLPPAMHPEVDMPHEIMRLRPGVSPALPFPHAPEEVAPARPSAPVRLADGDTLVLEAGPVLRRLGQLEIPGYAFNGQIPGPRIEAEEGSTVHLAFRNRTPLPAAVHWHGLRLGWRFDGVPGVTQDPVEPGQDFHYELALPDEGTFWYHPHLREDIMQDMGLAGNIRVHPSDREWYDPVDHEEYLVLDDHLVGPEGPVPYGEEAPIHVLMGRFGNVLLVNGSRHWEMEARPGETLRLHLTNAAATRTFNLSLVAEDPDGEVGLPLRVVGSDLGALPRTTLAESAVVAPAERWVVEAHLPADLPAGTRVRLENRVQGLDHMAARFFASVDTLGTIRLQGNPIPQAEARREAFHHTRSRPEMEAEIGELMDAHLDREPDHTLVLDLRTGQLPFPLDPLFMWEGVFRPLVEWEGTMPDMDWLVTGHSAEWLLRDPDTGAENMEVDWRFQVGDRVKLRLVNDRDSLHPMQHPIHLHGQRFLVLAVDGVPNEHPAWKDTVLVPVGAVVDLLLELDNPGPWMIHCHISEHLESGMMSVIHVEEPSQ